MPLNASLLATQIQQEYIKYGWNIFQASHIQPFCQILAQGIVETLSNRAYVNIITTVTSGNAGNLGIGNGNLTILTPPSVFGESIFAELLANGWNGQYTHQLSNGFANAVIQHLAAVMILTNPIVGVAIGNGISQIILNTTSMQMVLEQKFMQNGWVEKQQGNPTSNLLTSCKILAKIISNQMNILLSGTQNSMTIWGGIPTVPIAPISGIVDTSGYLQ